MKKKKFVLCKSILTISLALFVGALLIPPDIHAQTPKDKVSMESRSFVYINDITGPGRESTFYRDGVWLNEELDMQHIHHFLDDWRSKVNLDLRWTDNERIDPERFSVEKFSVNAKNKMNEITIGDYFANFSQYAMSRSIKGAAYQRNFVNDRNYIRAAFGSFDGQWDYLFEDLFGLDLKTKEPVNRFGGGVRAQHGGKKYHIGFSSVFVMDEHDDPKRTTEDAYQQFVEAVDWQYREKMYKLSGDHAISFTSRNPVTGDKTAREGWANKLKFNGKFYTVRLNGKFEVVDPHFNTLAGGATPDRVRYYGKASQTIAKVWKVHVSYNYYYNRINDRSSATIRTFNDTLEGGITRKKLFNRKRMKITLTARRRKSKAEDDSKDQTTDRIKLKLSDKIFKILKYRANVEGTFTNNDVTKTLAHAYLYSLDLSARHKFEGFTLRPSFFISHRVTDNLTTEGDDKVDTFRIGLNATKGVHTLGANYENVWTNVFEGTDSLTRRFSAFWEWKVQRIKNSKFRISGNINDYDFSSDGSFDKDYLEKRLVLSFRVKI